jgi:two-component system response regulator
MTHDPIDILLIEDNPNDVELALDALRENKLSNHIEVVRDGAAALDFLFCTGEYTHRDPDSLPRLILLDMKLPKRNGLEVLQEIRANPHTQTIPVVIMTSSTEERDIYQSYQQGVNSYIVKPVDFEQFTAAVKHLGFYWLLLNKPPNG